MKFFDVINKPRCALFCALSAAALWLAACSGTPLDSEIAARKDVDESQKKLFRAELPELSASSSKEDYVKYALLRSPRVKAAFHEWKAATEAIAAARSLPDPKLEFEAEIDDTLSSAMPGFMFYYTLPEKRAAAGDYAASLAREAYFEFRKTALETADNLMKAWADYEYYKQSVILRSQELEALEKNYQYAVAEYSAQSSGTLDKSLAITLEAARARAELENAQDAILAAKAAFKAALGIPREGLDLPFPQDYPHFDAIADTNALWQEILKQNPDLSALRAAVLSAEADVRIAKTSELPDFEVGLYANVVSSPVMFKPVGKMTLPIWRDKIESYIASARGRSAAAAMRLEASQIELGARLAQAEFELKESARIARYVNKDAIPAVDAAINSAAAGYAAGLGQIGRIAELEVLRAYFANEGAKALRDLRKAHAELHYMLLGDLPQSADFLSVNAKP